METQEKGNARQEVEDQLNELLQKLFELSVIVYDFQPDGNKLVWKKINSIIEHYKEIEQLKDGIDSFIPEEVINFVEHGKNPEIFTQGFVERTATENQFTNGKINAVKEFRELLSEEFTKSFPDLYDNADNMLNASEADI
ncbi:mediator complex, subunit Med10 [Choanephora cucurbitarum]|nr:mediator complex, subunit Med10 [Choanephora cucurbitarum]